MTAESSIASRPASLLPVFAQGAVGTFSPWMATTPGIKALLGVRELAVVPRGSLATELDAILGFHADSNEAAGLSYAREHGLPYVRAYPGVPFRSGVRGLAEPPLSLILDVQWEAGAPAGSRIERFMASGADIGAQLLARAARLLEALRREGVEVPLDGGLPLAGAGRSREERFAITHLMSARHVDPDSGLPWEPEDALALVARQREMFAANAGRIYCYGFTSWKRTFVRAYLRSPHNRIVFVYGPRHARLLGFDERAKLLVWGIREDEAMAQLARAHRVPIWRMEDGFLRSVGLGADLTVPASLVVDREGIYFDPGKPSELEAILQHARFSAEELARAAALRALIVRTAISKYNVGDRSRVLARPDHPRVILIPGQVEDDASIRRGCRDVRTNLGLIEAVRAAHPGAYLIFKPHPDVTDARRTGSVPAEVALRHVDKVVTDLPLPACLASVDEVHTMTSLVGFEALLRGLKVSCYGQPFYAGWGLTDDRHPLARRTRRLALDELVAGTLLRYPRYLSRTTRLFTTPEVVVAQLQKQLAESPPPRAASRLRRELRRALHAVGGLLDAP